MMRRRRSATTRARARLGRRAGGQAELTSVNIESASSIFTGAPAQNLGGSFDNDTDNNIFKATFGSSFGSISFGNVAKTTLAADGSDGRPDGGGIAGRWRRLGNVDLIYVSPNRRPCCWP